jgi:hypothetical protein
LFITKEETMHYKTIILEMLEQRPKMREELRQSRKLLPTLEFYASELKDSHEDWKDRLQQAKPDSDPSQIKSKALEMALKDLEERLPAPSPEEDSEAPSLEGAIEFIRKRMPPA